MSRPRFSSLGTLLLVVIAGTTGACGPARLEGGGDGDGGVAADADPLSSVDTDGDTISDHDEGTDDTDHDGTVNAQDLDSDGDGLADADEAGDADLATPPRDTDGDSLPDFLDGDSDNDGLRDDQEVTAGTDPLSADTDGDGFSDLAEIVIHQQCVADPASCNGDPNPLDPNAGISTDDFVFVLPFQEPEQQGPLDFATKVANADIQFSMDTTGSMGDEINNLKTGLATTIAQIADPTSGIPNTAFGVSRYEDFPVDGHGNPFAGDVPFQLHQRVTTVVSAVQAGVNALAARDGSDIPEGGWEALWHIATGGVIDWTGGSVAAFDPAAGFDPATNGTRGGVGFREGSLPIIIQVTDARNHDIVAHTNPCQGTDIYGADAHAHGEAAALAALQGLGARVIGLTSTAFLGPGLDGCYPRQDYEEAARATNAMVPPAAFDQGGRPAGCAANQCCTGISGAGRAPDGDGRCPLVFDVAANGDSAFSGQIVAAVRALTNFAVFDIDGRTRSTPQPTAAGDLVDPGLFITAINAVTLDPIPPGGVTIDPTGKVFLDVQPGATAKFDVKAQNTIVPAARDPQVFTLQIEVRGDGVTVLDTRQVVIIVPPSSSIFE